MVVCATFLICGSAYLAAGSMFGEGRMFLVKRGAEPTAVPPGNDVPFALLPGASVTIEVYAELTPPGDQVKGYQVTMPCLAPFSEAGQIHYLPPPVVLLSHPLFIYADFGAPFVAIDEGPCSQGQPPRLAGVVGIVPPSQIPVLTAARYLGQFDYQLDADARGTATIVLPNEPHCALRDENSEPIPFTTDGATVTAPSAFSDSDADFDMDLRDVGAFSNCFSSAGEPAAVGCEEEDHDGDADVDLTDFASVLPGLTGPHEP